MEPPVLSWLEARKRYRIIVYSLGLFSLAVIIFLFSYQAVLTAKKQVLVSAAFDGPFFETCKLVFGAIFGGALVGAIFDGFQSKVLNSENHFISTMAREGIQDVFSSDRDPKLIEWLSSRIDSASTDMTFVGLGLGFLVHNRELLESIANRISSRKNLKVTFVMGASDSAGVTSRAREEHEWHKGEDLAYDGSWVDRYPAEISTTIRQNLTKTELRRVKFLLAKSLPTISIVKIDDDIIYYSYGPPSIRGSQSPWLLLRIKESKGYLPRFLLRSLEYYADPNATKEYGFE